MDKNDDDDEIDYSGGGGQCKSEQLLLYKVLGFACLYCWLCKDLTD